MSSFSLAICLALSACARPPLAYLTKAADPAAKANPPYVVDATAGATAIRPWSPATGRKPTARSLRREARNEAPRPSLADPASALRLRRIFAGRRHGSRAGPGARRSARRRPRSPIVTPRRRPSARPCLLRRPLSAEAAVEVAFLRNKSLQAAYNDLGVSEARCRGEPAAEPRNLGARHAQRRLARHRAPARRLTCSRSATLPTRQDRRRRLADGAKPRPSLCDAETRRRGRGGNSRAQWRRGLRRDISSRPRGATRRSPISRENSARPARSTSSTRSREFAFYAELSADLAKARTQEAIERSG